MPENFKDLADSYTNHHDFSSGVAEGSNLVWWTPCFFLAKKETKLPTRQVTWCKSLPNVLWQRKQGSVKEASIPLWKAGALVSWEGYFHLLSGYQIPSALIPGVAASWNSGGLPDWAWGFHVSSNENKEQLVEILKLTCNYYKHFRFQNEILLF